MGKFVYAYITVLVLFTQIATAQTNGKYLLLPPDYTGVVPDGYTILRPKTYNTYTLLRSIVASRTEADVKVGDALAKQVKIYPLSQASNPPALQAHRAAWRNSALPAFRALDGENALRAGGGEVVLLHTVQATNIILGPLLLSELRLGRQRCEV